jgi:hypothetical protein
MMKLDLFLICIRNTYNNILLEILATAQTLLLILEIALLQSQPYSPADL